MKYFTGQQKNIFAKTYLPNSSRGFYYLFLKRQYISSHLKQKIIKNHLNNASSSKSDLVEYNRESVMKCTSRHGDTSSKSLYLGGREKVVEEGEKVLV